MIGFFDSLRIELSGSGVDVSVIAPDFVVSEIHKRAIGADGEPLGESPMVKAKIMTAEACARRIARAIERRERQVLMSTRGKLGRWLKLLAPAVIDRMAARAIRQRH
jgi:short-subunit dehydrogenase